MTTRQATHAGSWYTSSRSQLDSSLNGWLQAVKPSEIPPRGVSAADVDVDGQLGYKRTQQAGGDAEKLSLPVDGCRAVIAPHAGYSYSGPAAAWAYATIDPEKHKRIFILGPSHHHYLSGCALSKCQKYATPIGDLPLDLDTIGELRRTGEFEDMSLSTDEDEHSIEMHLPYVRKIWQQAEIKIVPILVGSTNVNAETKYGRLLAPYLADPETFVVVSSDFCHWGSRFRYTHYHAPPAAPTQLRSSSTVATTTPIHMSIRALDAEGMSCISFPSPAPFLGSNESNTPTQREVVPDAKSASEARNVWNDYLEAHQNTICGRHPIGVLLAALEELQRSGHSSECRFTRYEQSSQCLTARDSSVSYASAFIRIHSASS
ncbi:UPF0103-domain-containing protein [Ceraceosorus guamensis]|uniref:UPF0103-domain-containing protein n=1 Tax=Ceraceosorus guamensis TaxID=1522189 RepID=A0A316W153_9BASI|nr:UPF0103-domain-containing protein [Ceraceosorus guamensis]PWN42291.1 UPF0103-domain-containing protein [Ceraceosorus guamensis]